MAEYLLEMYVARDDARGVTDGGEHARAAAEELTRRGTAVQFCRSIFIPAEETCFVLFEAESADAVRDAARLADLPCERVSAVAAFPGAVQTMEEGLAHLVPGKRSDWAERCSVTPSSSNPESTQRQSIGPSGPQNPSLGG